MAGASFAEFIRSHEPAVRLGCFLGVTATVALWEAWAPRRTRVLRRLQRWPANIGMALINTLTVRLLLPSAAVGAALAAAEHGWGIFNIVSLPSWTAVLLSLLLLDLTIYVQHVLFHVIPPLWRLHRMHHSDVDLDVTTGARFHPVEILLSALLKIGAVTALGAPVLAVIVFEVVLNAVAMFNHANAGLPRAFDRVLRWVVVTPDIHHSAVPEETNRNYGFNLPWWDKLFGTYRAQPAAGHVGMTIGLAIFREAKQQRPIPLLTQPFRRPDAPG